MMHLQMYVFVVCKTVPLKGFEKIDVVTLLVSMDTLRSCMCVVCMSGVDEDGHKTKERVCRREEEITKKKGKGKRRKNERRNAK